MLAPAVAASANVGRPYIASSTVMPRKYAGFTRTCRSLRQSDAAKLHDHGLCNFLAAARFEMFGKASFHAVEGFNNLFPFVSAAHAKFF